MNRPTTITRSDLYEQVWSTPMIKLAQQYGLSDNGLRKICRKLNIPTPKAGYWAKLEHGKKVSKIPLPELKHGESDTYKLTSRQITEKPSEEDPRVRDAVEKELQEDKITVSERLASPHLLVEMSRNVLTQTKPGDYGLLRPWGYKCLDIRVGPDSLRRALRLMDALVKALEQRGFKVDCQSNKTPDSTVLVYDHELSFSIEERVSRSEHIPTQQEIKKQEKYSWERPPRWDYSLTGKLKIKIDDYGASGFRKLWSDTKRRKLEDLLNDFILGAIKVAIISRDEKIKREREWEEARKKRVEEEQRRYYVERIIRNLDKDSESWAKSRMIRSYIREVEKVVAQRLDRHTFQEQYEEWLALAKQYADRLDPLTGGSFPFVDETDSLVKEYIDLLKIQDY